jgi:hypothetical protein
MLHHSDIIEEIATEGEIDAVEQYILEGQNSHHITGECASYTVENLVSNIS